MKRGSRPQVKRKRRRYGWMYFVGFVTIALLVALLWFPWQMKIEACEEHKTAHSIRFRVINNYDQAVWVNLEFSWPGLQTETKIVQDHSDEIAYTRHLFREGESVNVTFRALDPTTQRALPDEPVVFHVTPSTPLIGDSRYHEMLVKQYGTTTTLRLDCLSEEVYDGPVLRFGS